MKLKYRIPAILLALILSVSFQSALVWAENEGEDAHSQSMSAESGEEPIEDLSTTEDYTEEDAFDASDPGDEEEDVFDTGEEVDPDEEDLADEDAEDAQDESEKEISFAIPWKAVIPACAGVIALIAGLIYAFRRWDS